MLGVIDLPMKQRSRTLTLQTPRLSRADMSIFTCQEHAAPPPQIFESAVALEQHSSLQSRTHDKDDFRGQVEGRYQHLCHGAKQAGRREESWAPENHQTERPHYKGSGEEGSYQQKQRACFPLQLLDGLLYDCGQHWRARPCRRSERVRRCMVEGHKDIAGRLSRHNASTRHSRSGKTHLKDADAENSATPNSPSSAIVQSPRFVRGSYDQAPK